MTIINIRKPFYKNLKFWLVFAIAFILILTGCSIAFGFRGVLRFVLEPSVWITAGAGAGVIGATLTAIVKAFSPVWEELRKIRGEAEVAKSKAVTAEAVAKEVTVKTNETSERATFLETSYEALSKQYVVLNSSYSALSRMAERLTDNLQEEQAKADVKIDRLEAKLEKITQQNAEQHEEIVKLREQIRLMGLEKSDDKEQIILLKGRVKELETQVEKFKSENEHLQEKLKTQSQTGERRRATDELRLPTEGITSGDTVRIERIDEVVIKGRGLEKHDQ